MVGYLRKARFYRAFFIQARCSQPYFSIFVRKYCYMTRWTLFFLLLFPLGLSAQNSRQSFQHGEWLEFRLHYGVFNASYATFKVSEERFLNKPVYHVVAHGETTGLAALFFKVDDTYESYFTKKDHEPLKFIRKVDEGGYTMDLDFVFDHVRRKAVLTDHKKNKQQVFDTKKGIQDLVSAFYYLRNHYQTKDLYVGKFLELDMLYDDDGVFKFKLEYLGREVLRTKFGKVSCLKFRPYVQSERVFKEQEALTLWVSDDENRIPIRIKADLVVGSLRADLNQYAKLKHPFEVIHE